MVIIAFVKFTFYICHQQVHPHHHPLNLHHIYKNNFTFQQEVTSHCCISAASSSPASADLTVCVCLCPRDVLVPAVLLSRCVLTLNPHLEFVRFTSDFSPQWFRLKWVRTVGAAGTSLRTSSLSVLLVWSPWKPFRKGGREGGTEGGRFLPPTPAPTPPSAVSACDGAEPAVCYGVSPPRADRTPPVCFDKAP